MKASTSREAKAALNLPLAFALAIIVVGVTGLGIGWHSVRLKRAPTPQESATGPAAGVMTGAYIDFGEKEDDVTLEKIEEFEQLVGKHQAIIASSSFWGEQTFPTENVKLVARHGSLPLVFWSPWDRPYK